MFEKVSQILPKKRILVAARICYEAEKLDLNPISFSDGVLTLSVKNSSEASELQFKKSEILEKINKKIGRNIVEKIRTKIHH